MRYFRRRWEESRGDNHDAWGSSEWFFEVAADGFPERQVERYADGTVLKYDRTHLEDEFGGLGDQPLDLAEFAAFEIDAAEFERVWASTHGRNR